MWMRSTTPHPNPLRGGPCSGPTFQHLKSMGADLPTSQGPQSLRRPQADSPLTMFSGSEPPIRRFLFLHIRISPVQETRSPSSESKQKHPYVVSIQRPHEAHLHTERGSAWLSGA